MTQGIAESLIRSGSISLLHSTFQRVRSPQLAHKLRQESAGNSIESAAPSSICVVPAHSTNMSLLWITSPEHRFDSGFFTKSSRMIRFQIAFACFAMMTAMSSYAQSPAVITSFGIQPGAAAFGEPIELGTPIGLEVSGFGVCQVSFLVRPVANTNDWREAALVEGRLPLSARLAPLPKGEYWLTFRSDCTAAKFRQEFRVRVADTSAVTRLRSFVDAEAPRCNHLPLGTQPQIKSQRHEDGLAVTVLANFACHTTAGEADARLVDDVLVLTARTSLTDFPTLRCLCTRKLTFVVAQANAKKIRYLQDQWPGVEVNIDD